MLISVGSIELQRQNIQLIDRARMLFEKKAWLDSANLKIGSCSSSTINPIEEHIFNMFCLRLEHLTEDERNFVFELSDDFLWVKVQDYCKLFLDTLPQLSKSVDTQERIVFLNVIFYKDRNRSKSGGSLLYLLENIQDYTLNFLKNDHPNIKSLSYTTFTERKQDTQDFPTSNIDRTYYCIVDDFSGTGTTACKALDLVASSLSHSSSVKNSKQLGFLCLVAQEAAKQYVQQKNYTFICNKIRKRGISDFKRKYGNIEKMKKLEKKLGIESDFFGYKDSESLVSLINTPNNTFPYFWKDGDTCDAPFVRATSRSR